MKEFVFLLEERSMKVFLESLLSRILKSNIKITLIPHEGKTDLQKSIPRKLRAWQNPEARFVILHDQDSHDCKKLKQKLQKICAESGKPNTLIRIVCRELESWFLGDLRAVEKGMNLSGLASQQTKKKFRNPDRLNNAAEELCKIVPSYSKMSGASAITPYMNIGKNCSKSFQVFVEGIRRITY